MVQRFPKVINEDGITKTHCPIRPQDIEPDGNFGGVFETALAAGRLLMFFKEHGCWCGFTLDSLGGFYLDKGWDPNVMLYGLFGTYSQTSGILPPSHFEPDEPLIVMDSRGVFHVTDAFINRCVGKSRKAA